MNKKSRKRLVIMLLIVFMAVCGGAWYLYLSRTSASGESQTLALKAGQELVYAKITSISGNEMDYVVMEAQTVDLNEMSSSRKERGSGRGKSDTAAEDGQDGQMPSERSNMADTGGRSGDAGERPSGGGMSGNMGGMPSGGMPDTGMPFPGEMPSGAESQEEKQSSDGDAADDTQNRTVTTYTETKETGKMLIPVGTEVETKLGTVTTFSRLSSGDIIQMLLQKDDNGSNVLIKIWIVE